MLLISSALTLQTHHFVGCLCGLLVMRLLHITDVRKCNRNRVVCTNAICVCRFGAFPGLLRVQEEEEAAHKRLQTVDLKPAPRFIRDLERRRPRLLRDETSQTESSQKVTDGHGEMKLSN